MSRPDSDDFDKKLKTGPLNHKGFSDRLQQRIEQSVNSKEKSRSHIKPLLFLGGGTAALAFVLIFPWQILHKPTMTASLDAMTTATEASTIVSSPPPVNTALLIGLRKEQETVDPSRKLSNTQYSTYRTLLVAPVKGELQKTSEGEGILMPYKQSFWKIDSLVHKTATEEIHYLAPHPANQPTQPKQFPKAGENDYSQRIETLIFTGNEYLSIVVNEQTLREQTRSQSERAWVRTLPQLSASSTLELTGKPTEGGVENSGYVSLNDLYGAGINGVIDDLAGKRRMIGIPSEISGRNWLIARAPGRWIAKATETSLFPINNSDNFIAHDFPRGLPTKVSNYDTICCSWAELQATWPNAKDALTSPLNDMIVIFEADALKFYPYGIWPNPTPLLTIPLQPGESLVMAQWATEHYVQEWIDKVAKLLK